VYPHVYFSVFCAKISLCLVYLAFYLFFPHYLYLFSFSLIQMLHTRKRE
jgi:hypothetical protein